MNIRRVVAVSIALVFVSCIAGCGKDRTQQNTAQQNAAQQDAPAAEKGDKPSEASQKDGQKDKPKRDTRVPVEAALVTRGDIEAYISASANLETESSVRVLSRKTNLVTELMVEEGDRVSKGQVLARLENEDQRIALEKAKSTYERNKAEYERQKHLIERKLVSDKGFADTTYQFHQSKLDRDNAQLNYDFTIIKAPIDGTLTQRLINLGDQVTNNKHLFDIVDFDTMVARVFLPEEHLPSLSVGQQARVYSQSYPEQSFSGEVLRVSPVVDARSGTVKVTVAVGAKKYLRPGMYVDVHVITETRSDTVLVPKKALVYDDEQTYVYRIVEGVVERVAVRQDIVDVEYFKPVKADITAGDVVVVAGVNGLKNKAQVRVVNDEELTKAKQSQESLLAEERGSEGQKPRLAEEENTSDLSREKRRARMEERMKNMTEEERKAFIEKRNKRRAEREGEKDAA